MKLLLCVVTVCLLLSLVVAEEQAVRVSNKHEITLDNEVEDRAGMFFRQLDSDFDKKIGQEDIERGQEVLAEQMPGVTIPQFLEFMSKADVDGDKHLSREEFVTALTQGVDASKQQSPEFIEAESTATKRGFLGKVLDNVMGKVQGSIFKSAGIIDTSQDGCVMCQYIVERIETNVKASGVIPGLGAPGPAPADGFSFVEVENKEGEKQEDVALVETEEKGPWQAIGASIIGSTRQTTRYQRQIERQKFNEIYRVADITLDDVCEQGMPNAYYGYCKTIYKFQSDIVDGLRYQYRPTDICFRVGMCKKKSYITKGIHSRYRTDN